MAQERLTVMDREQLLQHMVTRIGASELHTEPWDYLTIPSILPDEFYAEALANEPPDSLYHGLDASRWGRADGTPTRTVVVLPNEKRSRQLGRPLEGMLASCWTDLYWVCGQPEFKAAVLGKLREAICIRLNMEFEQVLAEPMSPLLRLTKDIEQYKIAPHCDRWTKLMTMQIYLPADDSQSGMGTSVYIRKGDGFKEVARMPFVPNMAYAFVPLKKGEKPTWHGVEALGPLTSPRHTVMLELHQPSDNMSKR